MGKERLLGLALLLELVQDIKSLSDLGIESLLGVEEVQKLVVVHLEQHACDLTGELRLSAVKNGDVSIRHSKAR